MNFLIALVTTYFCTLTSLILIILPGLLLYSIFQVANSRIKPFARVTTSFVIGFSILVTIFFLAGRFGRQANTILLSFLVLSLISIVVFLSNGTWRIFLIEIKTLAFASLIGLWQFIPGVISTSSAGMKMNMVAIHNNDIAFYAGVASEFLKTGFNSDNHLASTDLNTSLGNGGYHSPFALMSFMASIFHLSVWQITTPAIGLVIAMSSLGLARLIGTFFQELSPMNCILIATGIMMTSFMSYIQINYFLGQVFALLVCTILIASVMDFTGNHMKTKIQYIEIFFLVILSIYTYPPLLLPFDLAILLFFALQLFRYRNFTSYREAYKYLAAFSLGLLFSSPNLISAYRQAKLISKADAGWPLPILDPLNMTIFPSRIGIATPTYLVVALWIIVLGGILYSVNNEKLTAKERENAFIFAILVPIMVVLIILFRKQGFHSYQSWKLISYIFPVSMAAALPLLVLRSKHGEKVILIFAGITSTTAMTLWGGTLPHFVNNDLVEVGQMQKVQSLKSLNISVDPFFETMAAAQIISRPRIFTNSISYYPLALDPDACTLVHFGDKNFPYVERLNATYGLASTMENKCSARPPGIKLGETLVFNSQGITPNGAGWSTPEEWGTWTNGKSALLNLTLESAPKSSLALTLNSYAFLDPNLQTQDVTILANKVVIGRIHFTNSSNSGIRQFKIPLAVILTNKESLSIEFVVAKPIAPSSLGSSGDIRELGMGLISIKLK